MKLLIDDIPGWLTRHEGQFLQKASESVKNINASIVEIGSYCGKSTLWLALGGQDVYAVDPHKGTVSGGQFRSTYKQFMTNLKKAKVEKAVHPIVKTSADASKTWDKPVKFLFIDGLHDELHASEDYRLWSGHVVDGGIIAMHDAFCGWEGAGDVALTHIVRNTRYREIGVVGSILYGVKGKANKVDRIILLFRKTIIELCTNIYKSYIIPKGIQFVLVHRFLRIFLINEFSSFF